jgi:putative endonuclease
MQPCVYILASQKNGTLYIGVTSDLIGRVFQHREKLAEGFTNKHNVKRLIYFEIIDRMEDAIAREKKLKSWNRQWKIDLIERENPNWHDLWSEVTK